MELIDFVDRKDPELCRAIRHYIPPEQLSIILPYYPETDHWLHDE
jgi:hypothetical protein